MKMKNAVMPAFNNVIFWPLFLMMGMGFIISCNGPQKPSTDILIQSTSEKGEIELPKEATVVQSTNVVLNQKLLKKGAVVSIELFELNLSVTIVEQKTDESRNSTWQGKISDDESSYVLITSYNGVFSSNILYKGTLYQLRYIGNKVYQLRKIDQTKFIEEQDPLYLNVDTKPDDALSPCPNTDSEDIIDVMVLYTAAAKNASGGQANIEAEIYLAVQETNLSYQQSGVSTSISLVHTSESSYTETGSFATDVIWLQSNTGVANLRDLYFADLVVLIEEVSGFACGRAYSIMNTVSTNFEANAFCVVNRSCSTGYYSFGHELGHLMGCRHNCQQDGTLLPYDYAHGYAYCGSGFKWRTVMSYNLCGNTRIPFWSNPNNQYNNGTTNSATGTTAAVGVCQADNRRTINENALTVANFRCSSESTADVWMKDSWNDTGAEPDPNTVGENFWLSPYIWVRNNKDNQLNNQHQHQDPEFGNTNYVYVKLHNGGSSINGILQLWYANASLSLFWPADWTQLTSIPLMIAPNSTRIVEHTWNNLPGTGHYCMLARWVSAADPMAFTENIDINYNTIQNNNIVWKNMTIVDLVNDEQDIVELNFIPLDNCLISFDFDYSSPFMPFLPEGELLFSFDEETYERLVKDKINGKGFEEIKPNLFKVTDSQNVSLSNIESRKDQRSTLKLFFNKQDAQNQMSLLHIKQSVDGKVIGGVSYEIRLNYLE